MCTVGLMCIYTLRTVLQTQSQRRKSKSPPFTTGHLILPCDPRHPVYAFLRCTVIKKWIDQRQYWLLSSRCRHEYETDTVSHCNSLYCCTHRKKHSDRYSTPSPCETTLKKTESKKQWWHPTTSSSSSSSSSLRWTKAVPERPQPYVNHQRV